MQQHDPLARVRTLTLRAMARGWLAGAEVWEIARRSVEEGASAGFDVLESFLGAEKFAHLSILTDALETEALSDTVGNEADAAEFSELLGRQGEERYQIGEVLGVGGTGKVISALDREIGRVVAKKLLHQGAYADPVIRAKFIREARIAAQLEHPGIVPVHDIGLLSDGQPFFTMRVVKRTSLRDVLKRPELRKMWPLGRLLHALAQVCRALGYAHSRGVLHRDIKPENILLGDFGEVYLSDWGVAKVLRDSPLLFVSKGDRPTEPLSGTPGYMAPEVLRGDKDRIDHRADLFAVGVVLYEVLTGEHPFDGGNSALVTLATCEREPKRPSEIQPECPLVLEDLCMSLLAKDPAKRPASAEEVASEILAFLEGDRERERRREKARQLCEEATMALARYDVLEAEAKEKKEQARALARRTKDWEPISRKRHIWELEDAAEAAWLEAGRVHAQAIELYKNALEYDPQNQAAHRGLAKLYWQRARMASEERRKATEVYYEALVAQHDDGTFLSLLRAPAELSVISNPIGAEVVAHRYEEHHRVLVPGPPIPLGTTPVIKKQLEPGSYLLILRKPGYADVRYPLQLPRGASERAEVNLYTPQEIGPGFVYVPGSKVIIGGDPDAIDPLPRQEIYVPDFAIRMFPVTMREYCAFLDELERGEGPAAALRRAPRDRVSEGMVVRKGASGRWEPDPVMIEGEARELFPEGEGHEWRVPAHLVDWYDAVAFCRYLSQREGVEIRLPTEVEWEKAARGADGRFFPWGDHFDPSFCLMRASRPYPPQPEPIGTFPVDESPYGVRDMAGGMREWVGDIFGEFTAEELLREPEPDATAERGQSSMRQVRSGSWNADRSWSRAASRGGQFALVRGTGLGFRVAKTLVPKR